MTFSPIALYKKMSTLQFCEHWFSDSYALFKGMDNILPVFTTSDLQFVGGESAEDFHREELSVTFVGPCIANIVQYICNKMQLYTVYYIWKLLCMFQVLLPPIIRSTYNCIYSIWYLSHCYCYLPLHLHTNAEHKKERCTQRILSLQR